jgi:hypothetical protein
MLITSPARRLRFAVLAVVLVLAGLAAGLLIAHRHGSGTTAGSGVAAVQARRVPAFSGLDLAGVADVAIRVGRPQAVTVRADDNLVGRVTTRVRQGVLTVGERSGNMHARTPIRVAVDVPALRVLALSGNGTLRVSGLRARRLGVRLSGAGSIRASGSAGRLDVTLSGAGEALLGRLLARDVHAAVSGMGRIEAHARRRLDATIRGAGSIGYRGRPAHVTTSVTGMGAVVHR